MEMGLRRWRWRMQEDRLLKPSAIRRLRVKGAVSTRQGHRSTVVASRAAAALIGTIQSTEESKAVSSGIER